MSWQASAWVDDLPMDIEGVGPVAFRVLLKLANVANANGQTAWRMRHDLASELGRSVRTIDRAFKELEYAVLIREGDQQFVKHMRADRRPKVYDLNFQWRQSVEQPELEFDVEGSRGDMVIHNLSRGDMQRVADGATADVSQGTILRTDRSATKANHRSSVAPSTSLRQQTDQRCPSWRRLGHHNCTPDARWMCETCGRIDIEGNIYAIDGRTIVERVEVHA